MTETPKAEKKEARRREELARFVRQYGRKARRRLDSNDRGYDRGLQGRIRRMPAEELDRLLREDEA